MIVWTILWKEIIDGLRDRRSLLNSIGYSLMIPLFIPLMYTGIIDKVDDSKERAEHGDPEVAVIGMEHAPAAMERLDRRGFNPVPFEGTSPEEAVAAGDLELVLRISEDYREDWQAGRPASIELIHDGGNDDASRRVRQVQTELYKWGAVIGQRRLMARGIAPDLGIAVAVQEVDVSSAQQRGSKMLFLVPMFLLMSCFLCSMYVAIDMGAGERERGSLEALVLTTATSQELAWAKWAAAFLFGSFGVVLTAALSLWVLRFVDLEALGLQVAAGPRELGMFLLLCLPLTALAAAIQLFLATYSRSFKEAQTYLSFVVVLPMLPGSIMAFSSTTGDSASMAIPGWGHQVMMDNVLAGEGLPGLDYGLSTLSCVLLTAVFVWACGKLLRRESVIFGR